MIKKVFVGILAAVVLVAVGTSVYNVFASQTSSSDQAVLAAADAPVGPGRDSLAAGQGNALGQGRQGQGLGSTQADQWQGGGKGQGGQGQGGGNGQGGQGGQGQHGGNGQGGQAGQGQRGRGGQGGQGAHGGGNGAANPQNGLTDWVTISGVVSSYAAPNLTLVTADGQTITVQLGSDSYLDSIGLSLSAGDEVTLTGFYETGGSLAVGTLTVTATGQTFSLRDDLGRPMWRGGNQ